MAHANAGHEAYGIAHTDEGAGWASKSQAHEEQVANQRADRQPGHQAGWLEAGARCSGCRVCVLLAPQVYTDEDAAAVASSAAAAAAASMPQLSKLALEHQLKRASVCGSTSGAGPAVCAHVIEHMHPSACVRTGACVCMCTSVHALVRHTPGSCVHVCARLL